MENTANIEAQIADLKSQIGTEQTQLAQLERNLSAAICYNYIEAATDAEITALNALLKLNGLKRSVVTAP